MLVTQQDSLVMTEQDIEHHVLVMHVLHVVDDIKITLKLFDAFVQIIVII